MSLQYMVKGSFPDMYQITTYNSWWHPLQHLVPGSDIYCQLEGGINLPDYSGTSDKGSSEKRIPSLERTVRNVPILSFPIAIQTSEKRTTSLQQTKWLVPKCPLFRGSTVHKEEDNLSIVDEMAGPKVSFIQRFHCILVHKVSVITGKGSLPTSRLLYCVYLRGC